MMAAGTYFYGVDMSDLSDLVGTEVEGVVNWFDRAKGYGFISPEGFGGGKENDVFVHYSRIEEEGYRNLYEFERVRFQFGAWGAWIFCR